MPSDTVASKHEHWLGQLERSGYRITAPCAVVVQVMATSQRALSPVEVFDLARVHYPRLGLVTVYRTLEKLEAVGLVQRVHQAGNCNGYIAAPNGHQHLLICQNCGRTEYFSGDDLTALVSRVETQSHYRVRGHWLQLVGVCEACR